MKKVDLHIGHGKTGTSYIQSALALSEKQLSEAGILYPDFTRHFSKARAGRITSGNINPSKQSLYECLGELEDAAQQSILFSNEALFGEFRKPDARSLLQRLQDAGYMLRVLLFIRDPLEHAVSLYQQSVKRSGTTASLAAYIKLYKAPKEVGQALSLFDSLGIDRCVVNYSRKKNRLLEVVEQWLNLPSHILATPPVMVVNRSLTAAELELQKIFNQYAGRLSSALLSDPLCNELPHLKSEYPALDKKDLTEFLSRAKEMVVEPNTKLPRDEAYYVPEIEDVVDQFPTTNDLSLLCFSKEQIEVIARSLSQSITKHN